MPLVEDERGRPPAACAGRRGGAPAERAMDALAWGPGYTEEPHDGAAPAASPGTSVLVYNLPVSTATASSTSSAANDHLERGPLTWWTAFSTRGGGGARAANAAAVWRQGRAAGGGSPKVGASTRCASTQPMTASSPVGTKRAAHDALIITKDLWPLVRGVAHRPAGLGPSLAVGGLGAAGERSEIVNSALAEALTRKAELVAREERVGLRGAGGGGGGGGGALP